MNYQKISLDIAEIVLPDRNVAQDKFYEETELITLTNYRLKGLDFAISEIKRLNNITES